MQAFEGSSSVILKNGKMVPECDVCGAIEGDNFLLPYLHKTEFVKIYPHIGWYFKKYEVPEADMHFCNECITTMELRYLQEQKIEDMPLLINTNFYSDTARDYFTKVLKNSEKDPDVAVFASVLKKLQRLSGEIREEESIVG